jgi:glycerol-3-phosphate dehydrogenase (NAD(P)+)
MYGEVVKKVTVLGGGSFGSALALMLAQKHGAVSVWSNEAPVVAAINETHASPVYLPGVTFPENVSATLDLQASLRGAECVVIAVPSHAVRSVLVDAKIKDALVVCAAKGIETDTLKLMSDVCAELVQAPQAYLSGPSFAAEVAQSLPTSVVLAARDEAVAKRAQKIISMPFFRAYTATDVTGVELAGALKNVYAIAAGAIEGMGLGMNARAAMMTRGLNEMARLGLALGADAMTFAGLAGLGDLVLTCTGELSRNRKLGALMGRGASLADAQREVRTVAEGVRTAHATHALALRERIEMPIAEQVYRVLYQGVAVPDALRDLVSRELKAEW